MTTPLDVAMIAIEHVVASFSVLEADMTQRLELSRLKPARDAGADRPLLEMLQQSLPVAIESLRPVRHPSALAWASSGSKAKGIRDQLERCLEGFQELANNAASALLVIDQRRAEGYQRRLATLAAVLLAPGLVAGVFSASSKLNSSWMDLGILLALMMLTAIVSYWGISRYFARTE